MKQIKLALKSLGPIGHGVFTETDIPAGTEVLQFAGELRDVSDLDDLTHCLQVGERTFLTGTGAIDDFINHSCEPNCGVRLTEDNRVILFAFSDLKAGTQITFDYATTQSGEYETMTCMCKAPSCRKTIGGYKDLPHKIRNFYEKNNAVLPFLLHKSVRKISS